MSQQPIDKKVLNLNMSKNAFTEIWAYLDKSNNIQRLCLLGVVVCGYAHYDMWSLLGLSQFVRWYSSSTISADIGILASSKVSKYRTIADIGLLGSIIAFVLFRDKK